MNTALLLLGAAFSLWWVDPYGDKPYLPDAEPAGGVVTNLLSCAAARGEIESLSFSVCPTRDLKKVDFVPSDLTGPGGATIPASAADFALVKCWYRADGRWRTSWAGNTGKPTLVNDLILHDDGLVRVVESDDVAERTVLVRIDYPEGPVYVDMRKHGGPGENFNHGLHPIRDAKRFVPFDLKKDRFQQYWLTWRVPKTAKPGVYRGRLTVSEAGAKLTEIPLELEVYPFELPLARTHYDTSRPFISAWMGTPSLAGELARGKDLASAERRVRAVYRSLAEHNAHCPSGPGEFKACSTDDLAVRSLIMMRQEGMAVRALINGPAFDWGYSVGDGPKDANALTQATNRYDRLVRLQAEVYDRFLGHRNCYFSSMDECGTWFNRRSYPFWGILHRHGFEAWTDYGNERDIGWSVGMNDVPAGARHQTAWAWHKAGAKAVTYAGPFTGPLCPDIWRRTKGLRYYYADFDGHHEYCFYCGDNPWNDFSFRGSYSQFVIVYPTYDGLIASLAWEGVREGLDDIRYLSLLKLRAEAAVRSADASVRALGLRHLIWMESQDPEAVIDLFAFRREVARRAAELIAKVGPEPTERLPLPPPELPPLSTELKPLASADDPMAEAAALVKANRYDRAVPLLDGVRRDAEADVGVRVKAATTEVRLLSELLQRDRAVAVIDDLLRLPNLKGAQRAKLMLLRVQTMMTNRIFCEEYTAEQLDRAAALIAEALQRSGAGEDARYGAVEKIVDAYLAAGEAQKAIAFAEQRLDDMKLGKRNRCQLYLRQARGATQLKDWDRAAQFYRIAHLTDFCSDRNTLKAEGWVAEQRKDWRTAESCYSQESKMYSDEEKSLKNACIGRLKRVMAKLRESERKVDVFFDDDARIDIDLDE